MGNDLALLKKDTVDVVAEKVRQFQQAGEIHFPPNYSPENAMKSAWLTLQNTIDKDKNPVLSVCTRDSIANALLDMVIQGLNPAKKQGYFIAYGKTLVFQRSYFGTMAVTKNVVGAQDIFAQVIYKGDDFEYSIERGRKVILKHVQRLENIEKGDIVAAYCTIVFGDNRPDYTEIMTIDEIKAAWSMSKMNPESAGSTHQKFSSEMVKKTVINRTCKAYINSSNDSGLVLDHFNRADDVRAEAEVDEEIMDNANGDVIDVEVSKSEPMGDDSDLELKPTGTDDDPY